MIFIFDKLAPLRIYVSKDALNHFLVPSSAKKNILRSAKNVVFFLLCILVNKAIGREGAVASLPGHATEKHKYCCPYATFTLDCAF